jgi:hypothetical protein
MTGRGSGRQVDSFRRDERSPRLPGGGHHGPAETNGPRGWILLLLAASLGSLSILTGSRWLPPLLQAIPAWWVLLGDLRQGRPVRGAVRMLAWAVLASLTVIGISIHAPAAAEHSILRGAAYREEMFAWIRTGVGAESDPRRFIPQHALHYALVLGLSFASAGLAGLLLGTALLNYMNFYVGSLISAAASPQTAILLGWPPWSVLLVVGFILGAVAAAHLLLGRVLRRAPWNPHGARRMLMASLGLVLADITVKALLAPYWRVLLGRALAP